MYLNVYNIHIKGSMWPRGVMVIQDIEIRI